MNKQKRLAKLARSTSYKLRAAAAGNPMTDETTLFKLATDPEPHVRSWVVRNPSVPEWILVWKRDHDSDAGIRAYAQFRLDMMAELSV